MDPNGNRPGGGDPLAVFDYHGAEGAAVVRKYAFSGLFDGHSHESDIIFHHLFVNLYHTQPMYPATAGRNRLIMLIPEFKYIIFLQKGIFSVCLRP